MLSKLSCSWCISRGEAHTSGQVFKLIVARAVLVNDLVRSFRNPLDLNANRKVMIVSQVPVKNEFSDTRFVCMRY